MRRQRPRRRARTEHCPTWGDCSTRAARPEPIGPIPLHAFVRCFRPPLGRGDADKARKRATGFEPATYSLEGYHSTTELRPRRRDDSQTGEGSTRRLSNRRALGLSPLRVATVSRSMRVLPGRCVHDRSSRVLNWKCRRHEASQTKEKARSRHAMAGLASPSRPTSVKIAQLVVEALDKAPPSKAI